MKKTILSTLVSAALATAAAAPALAQTGSPGGEGPQARHFAQRQHEGQRASRLPSERAEGAARREQGGQPTAIERMEHRQAQMAAASARLTETLAAAKPLYAALSPEQQKIADELLTPRRHGPSRHGGGRPRA